MRGLPEQVGLWDGPPPAPQTRGRPVRGSVFARSSAAKTSGGACGCRSCARPPSRRGDSFRWCLRRNSRTRPSGRTAAALTNWHNSSKSASVSPGNPTMKLVRSVTPGNRPADALDQFEELIAVRPRFMRFSTAPLACCSGMSMYLATAACSAMVSRSRLGDPVRIGVQETDPLLLRCLDRRQPRQKVRQPVLYPQIFAVDSRVLADQVDLTNPLREQPAGFRPPPIRTGGCGYLPRYCGITQKEQGWSQPSDDLDIRVVSRGGENARRQVVVEIRLGNAGDRAILRRSRRCSPFRLSRSRRRLPACSSRISSR